jgi:hypothetical protein
MWGGSCISKDSFDDFTIQFAMMILLHQRSVVGLLSFSVIKSLIWNSTSTDRFVKKAKPVTRIMATRAKEHRVFTLLKLKRFGWSLGSLVGSRGSRGLMRFGENGSAIFTSEKQGKVATQLLGYEVRLIHFKRKKSEANCCWSVIGRTYAILPNRMDEF